ncbi:tetratricopeptide repeat protein [Pontibacter qinzhouensis]|uniref:Tetratricopeptide repeat protein n=1 Tax=Pontibacter qinzhouensis TaxID=2603253 RepID=A0A5C8KA59_9BACT|nr:tetratricopeptide repeat protein [Pontibacter qinzhouensis]TXK45717.1 tetratricopeptide repeat protein [Pontibacter qinzhouensis]
MHTYIKQLLYAAILTGLSGCSLVEVQNPNVTDESFLGTPQSEAIWLNGMNRQLAVTLNNTVHFTEIASDNYYNNSSLSNKVFDIPNILYSDLDVDNMQRSIARLSQMADYGLHNVAPASRETTDNIKADMHFIGGYAYLIGAELYENLPLTAGGPVASAAERLQKAIEYIKAADALQNDPVKKQQYALALARAYYNLGDKQNAVAYADNVVKNNPMLLLQVAFDGVNGVSNTMQTYTFSSSTNTYAPLPRLDFLDPKYYHVGNASTDQKPIAILKGEEAFLILAEAALGNNNVDEAKTVLKSLLEVVKRRPVASIDAKLAQRKGNRSDYPLLATVEVKFDKASPARSGFVLDRQAGNITVYTVSGSSVTEADIDGATTSDQVLYLLCLMRQEIFMSEGRRMTDLGMRFPVSQVEQQNNKNVNAEHTQAIIPSYIPGQLGMDDFTYDKATGLVTMEVDMNKVLVQNKTADRVLPLLK